MYLKVAKFDLLQVISSKDPLSFLMFYLVSKTGLPYPYINIPFGIIFFTGIHLLAKRQPDPLSFLILLFPILIINMPMSGLRQAASIGFICIAFTAFLDRHPFRFLLLVLIATGFHSSAIVFLILFPFATGYHNNTRLAIAVFLSVPGLIMITYLETVQIAAKNYIGSGLEAYGGLFRLGILILTGFYFLFFVKNKWKQAFPKDYALVNLGAIGMIIIFFILPVSSVIGDRFGYYLIPIQAMIFARIPYLQFRSLHLFHTIIPYFGIFLLFLIWATISYNFQKCYIPYDTWIFGIFNREMLRFYI
tara:strand:- start:1955 stop:2869 length:915 start_codon:yes stop_codon:yes gene_type:complete